jgi:hypothetical protein
MNNSNRNRKPVKQKRIIPTQTAGVAINKADMHPADLLVEQALLNNADFLDNSPPRHPSSAGAPRGANPPSPATLNFDQDQTEFPVSPERNFQKVSNTITKEAIPAGLFRQGKAKQLYDVLYSLTRGAIVPSRIVQINKPKLRTLTGIGAKTTLNACLESLEQVGLLKITVTEGGTYEGNIYEVFLPEEASPPSRTSPPMMPSRASHPNPPSPPSIPDHGQKVASLGGSISSQPSLGSTSINIGAIDEAKTLINTKKGENDDERLRAAFGDFELILDRSIKKHTGKGITANDKMKWKHVGEVLAAQIELIASRTTISNGPAVLAEHLQRHLNNKRVLEKMGLITPTEAKQMKEPESPKQEIPYLFLCPDCKGTRMWNPDGQGMRPGCSHNGLEEAVKRAKEAGEI